MPERTLNIQMAEVPNADPRISRHYMQRKYMEWLRRRGFHAEADEREDMSRRTSENNARRYGSPALKRGRTQNQKHKQITTTKSTGCLPPEAVPPGAP